MQNTIELPTSPEMIEDEVALDELPDLTAIEPAGGFDNGTSNEDYPMQDMIDDNECQYDHAIAGKDGAVLDPSDEFKKCEPVKLLGVDGEQEAVGLADTHGAGGEDSNIQDASKAVNPVQGDHYPFLNRLSPC